MYVRSNLIMKRLAALINFQSGKSVARKQILHFCEYHRVITLYLTYRTRNIEREIDKNNSRCASRVYIRIVRR